MQKTRFQKTKLAGMLVGGLAVTGVGLGAAATAFADPTPTTTPSAGQENGQPDQNAPENGGPGGRGGHGANQQNLAKELATKLGLDETKVSDALKAVREENKPQGQPDQTPDQQGTKPDPSAREAEMAKALATKLGVDEAKVTTALNEIHEAQKAERDKQFTDRLSQAVTDGKLTQAEADAVKKAADAGVIHGG